MSCVHAHSAGKEGEEGEDQARVSHPTGATHALEYVRFLIDCVPGYERASVVALGTEIDVGETRRVYGDYRVMGDDVLAAAQFDDRFALCGAPIEVPV
jgi:hypothetical protein